MVLLFPRHCRFPPLMSDELSNLSWPAPDFFDRPLVSISSPPLLAQFFKPTCSCFELFCTPRTPFLVSPHLFSTKFLLPYPSAYNPSSSTFGYPGSSLFFSSVSPLFFLKAPFLFWSRHRLLIFGKSSFSTDTQTISTALTLPE